MKIHHETLCIDSKGNISDRLDLDECVSIDVAKFDDFSKNRKQRRSVQSVLVRELLNASLYSDSKRGVDTSWTLNKLENGKPFLNGKNAPSISISHSGDWCACAVAKASVVGVDIETIKSRNWDAYCKDIFHPEESKWVLAVVGFERDARALICWCRKEAIVKALGVGLSVPLSEIGFSSEGNLIKFPKELGDPFGWRFFSRVIVGQVVVAAAWKS
jgi:phosphopantetheinyl transferase